MARFTVHTLSQGKLVWTNGDLRAVKGAGKYIKRPAFTSAFDAVKKHADLHAPTAVKRH